MSTKESIRSMLSGGDRRSIGRVAEVVDLASGKAKHISALVGLLRDEDDRIRMRAADVLEKISREGADFLQARKAELLGLAAETTQQELRWHLAVMMPRLRLTKREIARVAAILRSYLNDKSSIVKTYATFKDLLLLHEKTHRCVPA